MARYRFRPAPSHEGETFKIGQQRIGARGTFEADPGHPMVLKVLATIPGADDPRIGKPRPSLLRLDEPALPAEPAPEQPTP